MEKIIIIHHCGLIGGAGLSIYYIAKMLQENYEVVIYCPDNPSDLTEYLRERGLKVKTYKIPLGAFNYYSGGPSIFSRSFWRSLVLTRYAGKWSELLRSEKADLVIVNSMILCWLGKTIRNTGTKSICFVRETLPSDLFGIRNRLIRRSLNKNFNGVFFISEYDRRIHKLNQPITAVIRDCVNENEFLLDVSKEEATKKLGLKKNLFTMLFVGGMDPIKGLDIALKALKRLEKQNLQLVVAGYFEKVKVTQCLVLGQFLDKWRNRYYNKINHFIKKNNLDNIISFIGTQNNIAYAFSACDVLLFPSTKPHQARPVFEAGIYKKPVIISDFKVTAEHVMNNQNGLCFIPSDHKDLANKILALYYNREKIKELGLGNYQIATTKHSYNSIAKELRITLRKILDG